jgi:Bacterial alpha-L-rhamnosidase.
LGKKEDSVTFYKQSIVVKNAINQKLFDKNKGVYIDGEASTHSSLHANIFPLAFGIVPEKYKKTVSSFIKSRGMACSVYGAQFLLEALYRQGEADYALRLMTSTSDRSWWNMIKSGSTMALEAWDMKYKPNSDWNHAWGTAPVNIVTRYMWGITPTQPGFTKVQIKPQLGKLTTSKIMVPTALGPITAEYKLINNNDKLFVIELPQGMTGNFALSPNDKCRIMINKKHVKAKGGFVSIPSGLNRIELINEI